MRTRFLNRYSFGRGRNCYWCGREVLYKAGNVPEAASREHLRPISLNGRNWIENVVVACRACNSMRGHDTTWIPFHKLNEVNEIPANQLRLLMEIHGVYWCLNCRRHSWGRACRLCG